MVDIVARQSTPPPPPFKSWTEWDNSYRSGIDPQQVADEYAAQVEADGGIDFRQIQADQRSAQRSAAAYEERVNLRTEEYTPMTEEERLAYHNPRGGGFMGVNLLNDRMSDYALNLGGGYELMPAPLFSAAQFAGFDREGMDTVWGGLHRQSEPSPEVPEAGPGGGVVPEFNPGGGGGAGYPSTDDLLGGDTPVGLEDGEQAVFPDDLPIEVDEDDTTPLLNRNRSPVVPRGWANTPRAEAGGTARSLWRANRPRRGPLSSRLGVI